MMMRSPVYLIVILLLASMPSRSGAQETTASAESFLLRGGNNINNKVSTGTTNEEAYEEEGHHNQQDQNPHNVPRQLAITAAIVGNDGSPSSAFPLGECEGDCDNDSECESGLVCVQRSSGSALPSGCTGLDTSYSTDLCAKPPSSSSGGGGSSGSSTVARVGNDGSPSSAFPLGRCQGDCDNDGDCAGDLVCFQRRAYQSVPGCSGGSSDSTPTDYCIVSGSSGGSGSSTGDFYLRLYWQLGYMWQDDPRETRWCPKCSGSDCDPGDYMIIVDCVTDSPTKLRFVTHGSNGEFMIQIGGSQASDNLCMQLNTSTKNYELRSCDSNNPLQRFTSGNGSYLGSGRFEVYPKSKSGFCLTQRHHPKYGEQLRAETCDSARRSDTSYWIKR